MKIFTLLLWTFLLSGPNQQTTQVSKASSRSAQKQQTPTSKTATSKLTTSKPTTKKAITKDKKRFLRGKELMQKNGCFLCHSTDGTDGMGPTLYNIYMKHATHESGKKLLRTEEYFRLKISNSAKITLKGHRNFMPIYKDTFSKQQLSNIIYYIRYLRPTHNPKKAISKPK